MPHNNPHDCIVTHDENGWYILDMCYCEEPFPNQSYSSYALARAALLKWTANWEPPTGAPQDDPDFAGFADNH